MDDEQVVTNALMHSAWAKAGDFLIGWVVVAEWLTPEGNRRLSRMCSENTPTWYRQGYLQAAMDESSWEDGPGDLDIDLPPAPNS